MFLDRLLVCGYHVRSRVPWLQCIGEGQLSSGFHVLYGFNVDTCGKLVLSSIHVGYLCQRGRSVLPIVQYAESSQVVEVSVER